MFRLSCKIEIKAAAGGKVWTFDKVNSVEIVRDMEVLTGTCTIKLPKKSKWQGESSNPIKRGDVVTVSLGYDDKNVVAFRGYATTIGAKTPIAISCEDEMWALKNKPATKKAYKNATIEQILKDQKLSCKIKVLGEQSLGAYRVNTDTVAALLNAWKEQGIRSFFRYDSDGTPTLYCGVIFEKLGDRVQVFSNRLNIINDDALNVQSAADVKLKVKAISLDAFNKKVKAEVGDADGEVRTLHAYGKTQAELKAWATQELKRLKRDGLTGSFETFGAYLVDKLDSVGVIIDDVKMGVYQVKKNTITYSASGYRQNIEIGNRMDGGSKV